MGKLLVYVLAPFRFPVLQVFPGLPDNPAVIKAMVMLRQLLFPSFAKSRFYFITAVAILKIGTLKRTCVYCDLDMSKFSKIDTNLAMQKILNGLLLK